MPQYVSDPNLLAKLTEKPATGKDAPMTPIELQKKADTLSSDYQLTSELVGKAKKLSGPTTTGLLAVPATAPIIGSALGWTDAGELNNYLTTLKTRLGMDYLADLKSRGITLGQVTEAEHRKLQGMLGQLNQAGKERVLDTELDAVLKQSQRVFDSARQDYERSIGAPVTAPQQQSRFPTIQALPGFQPRQKPKK
jgi:hypothetical protein